MSTKKRTSPVWEYFDAPVEAKEKGKDVMKARCKLCGVQLAHKGGTTNLALHLSAKHPEEYRRAFGGPSSSAKQATLTTMVRKCSPERAATITKLIAEFVARDLRPLSVVSGDGFRQLLNTIEPGYQVPSHTHITKICRQIFQTTKEELRKTLEGQPHVALTTDIWTSRATQAYLTITAHFITAEWKMGSAVLQTQEMPERHTGVHISEKLKEATSEWGIADEKVVAVVHDNATNMVLAADLLEGWGDLSCFGHTLQLAVNTGLALNAIARLTAVCRKIVGHFKHSVVAMGALAERQRSLKIAEHSLIQDVATRWNSTYFMYERLAEQRVAIYAVIHDERVTAPAQRHLDLSDDQWDLLTQLLVVLKPLQVATTALCAEQTVSASLICPVVDGLLKHHLKIKEGDLGALISFKKVVSQELCRRFEFDEDSVAVLATAVDPRHSHLTCFTPEQRSGVQDILREKVQQMTSSGKQMQGEEPAKKKKKETAMSFLLGMTTQDDSDSSTEVDRFVAESQLQPDDDALEWWGRNEHRFPMVANLARRLLCVPATSVPSERIFSTAGMIVNNLRSSLSPDNVDMLIFLNKNLPSIHK